MKLVCMSLLLWLNKVITVNCFIAKETVFYICVYICVYTYTMYKP